MVVKKKETKYGWGGARDGCGRPPVSDAERKVLISISLPRWMWEILPTIPGSLAEKVERGLNFFLEREKDYERIKNFK